MRHPMILSTCIAGVLMLAACGESGETERAVQDLDLIDEANLNEIMLTAADPEEAVSYYRRALEEQPERVDLQRGLAKSLARAGRATVNAGVKTGHWAAQK